MAGLCAGLLVATMLAPPSDPPASSPAPGGYWSASEQRQRRGEPPDGDDELTIGSVLFSLGILRVGAAAVTVWMARTPNRCPVSDPKGCGPLEIYGWFGVGEGGLMIGTGLTYLIIGAIRRDRHRRWSVGERVMLSPPRSGRLEFAVEPWVLRAPTSMAFSPAVVGAGAQLQLRF